ncbi:MAG: hypothetical protein Q9164_001376 [Protoblastenia rupestris]
MTSTQPHPRRAYKTGVPPISTLLHSPTKHPVRPLHTSIEADRSLKKSATFHSPKSPASEDDPIVNIPLLSRRSPTSPKDLEDAVTAGEQRISQLLGSVDRSLSGLGTFSSDGQKSLRPDEHPVPRFMLGASVIDQDHMDIDRPEDHTTAPKAQPRRKHHTSDSGIGSTVTGSDVLEPRDDAGEHQHLHRPYPAATKTHTGAAQNLAEYKGSIPAIINHIQAGINGVSQSSIQHALSAYACRQIQKYLIVPILQEETLKNFHPLVTGIPIRVGRKEITCLRDLEKVLLWLAPRFSESRSSFIHFCETSIQCLHTTVEHLNEADQRRPSDRPYTNGYFLDLTEQVRQYAAMISAARERMAAGRPDAGDEETTYATKTRTYDSPMLTHTRNSKISLEGGIGQTGRPAELVRNSNGRSISLRTGEEIDLDAQRATRSEPQEMDEDILLSMARRRKAAAEKVVQRCSECDKEFKRPCDLTKHEKTHTRPWKCNDPSCKYSHYGWPTEKERDRHVNDKHSMTPSMFKCQFRPCPYESKRESNCKQHMEKAHGWAYTRSKNNGKSGRKPKPSSKSPPTPQMTTPGSYIFEASGSEFGDSSTSPYMHTSSNGGPTANGSVAATSPYLSMNDPYTPSPYEPNLTWNHPHPTLTPESPFTPASHRLSLDSTSAANDAVLPSSYDTSLTELDGPLFNTFDWSNMDTNFQTMNIQLFTPATSIGSRPMDAYHSRNPSISLEKAASDNGKLSPGAAGGLMLYSPHEAVADEGFDEFTEMGKPMGDFALFDDSRPDSMSNGSMNLFQDLPPFQSQTWSGQHFDTNMMDE